MEVSLYTWLKILFPWTKFPCILTSLNYHLLCKQRHHIQSQNGEQKKKKITWEKRKLLMWKHGSAFSGCSYVSVAGKHFPAQGSVCCSLSKKPHVLGSSAAQPLLGLRCMPSVGSKTKMQRCSPRNPMSAALGVLQHPSLFSKHFSQHTYFWKILITMHYRIFH